MAEFRIAATRPLATESSRLIQHRIQSFVGKWNSTGSLAELVRPDGLGSDDDIRAIDYVIYEHLYDIFFSNSNEFIQTGAFLLGELLRKRLRFEWCEIDGIARFGLQHPELQIKIPIIEFATFHLSISPQYECFESMFFDILLAGDYWQMGHHPLRDLFTNPFEEEPTYENVYVKRPPKEICELYEMLAKKDESWVIRELGLKIYDEFEKKNWRSISHHFDVLQSNYATRFVGN